MLFTHVYPQSDLINATNINQLDRMVGKDYFGTFHFRVPVSFLTNWHIIMDISLYTYTKKYIIFVYEKGRYIYEDR